MRALLTLLIRFLLGLFDLFGLEFIVWKIPPLQDLKEEVEKQVNRIT
jgi:hypothetical protein